ncbi:hypothetical protein ACFLZT_07480 [Thermodesulfobacteriota bacterium]
MKRALIIGLAVFLMALVFNPICFAQPKGKKGGKKGPPPKPPTHEEFVAIYDRDGDGEVTLDEFMATPPPPPPGGDKGPKGGKKGPK